MTNYYLTEIQNYFENLSSLHLDIKHGYADRVAFVRLQSEEAINQLPNNLGPVLVLITQFSGRAVGDYDANKLQQSVQIRFAKKRDISDTGDFDADIEAAMGESYLIMMDFISRMKFDFEADDCGWLKYVEFNSMSWSEFAGPWLERHYGWDLNIPFKAAFPAYNSLKWQ